MNPESNYISTDGTITITCDYEGVDAPTIDWYHGQVKLSSVTTTAIEAGEHAANKLKSTLTITDVTPVDNAGDYTCKTVFEDGDMLEDMVKVTVRTVNFVDSIGSKITSLVTSGGDLTLDCRILADKIPTDVKWYKGTGEAKTEITIDNVDNFVSSRSSQDGTSYRYFSKLTMKNFDEDSYMCEFMYAENKPSASIPVSVAKIKTTVCEFVDYQDSDEKRLECKLYSSSAADKLEFTSPDKQTVDGTLGEHANGDQSGYYDYIGLTSSSDGPYVCSFTLEDGAVISQTINLAARSMYGKNKHLNSNLKKIKLTFLRALKDI